MKNFIDELRWRGMLHDMMPGTEEHLLKGCTAGYVGIDPTADSLHIGHMVSIMILRHFQNCGHKPVFVLGGATGMIGDPSGKSQERNLLTPEILTQNTKGIRAQIERLVDFDTAKPNAALIVNNYDWMSQYSYLSFIRDIGKHITVNYMMAKDSVRRRINPEAGEAGLSYTEFSYQLIQATDFLHLRRDHGVTLQLGGSDQWGNMTTGAELIRRIDAEEVFCLTCPLITKADGRKFGKTEQGNVWLDPKRTSPYKFYQFWLNTSDEEAARYIRIFTLIEREEIESLEAQHSLAPHQRALQQRLAEEVTVMVHGQAEYEKAVEASSILFGKNTQEALRRLDVDTFLSVFDGVPTHQVAKSQLENTIPLVELLTEQSCVFPSKGEFRRTVQGGGLSINKERAQDSEATVSLNDALNGQYILVQRGKKEYHIIHLV